MRDPVQAGREIRGSCSLFQLSAFRPFSVSTLRWIGLIGLALALGACATDAQLGITTNQGPRIQETPTR